MGSWKAGSPTSHPPWLKAQSPKLFIVLQWSRGTIGNRHIPQQVLETQVLFSVAPTKKPRCLEFPEMDFPNKHVEKISLLAVRHVCEHGQLKGWQPRFQPTVAKSSLEIVAVANGKNTFQYSVTNLGDHNSVTKPMLLCMRQKSGILDKGMGSLASTTQAKCRVFVIEENLFRQYTWMLQRQDSVICLFLQFLNKHVQQISFRQRIRFCQHRQLKGWKPRFQPAGAKSNNAWRWQLRDPTFCLSAWDGFFLQLQQRDGHNAELQERAACLKTVKLLVGSGCLEFPKGMAGIDSLNKHV